MADFTRIFLAGDILQDGGTGSERLQDFLASHPDALVLDENVFANISGYSSTVEDEISLLLEPLCLTREDMNARVASVAQALGIEELLPKNPLALSGGQTQLVALASLLVGEHRPLALNSLLQGLDASMRARVLDLLATWQADILWTNPAQAFAEEEAFATEILREPAGEQHPVQQNTIPWQLTPATLIAHNLAISPEAPYKKGKRQLFKRQIKPQQFLGNLNLHLSPGDILLLRGSNGAGKTTFAKTIAGLLQPLDGAVLLGEQNLHELKPAERVARIAMAGQHAQHRAIASTLAKDLRIGPAASATEEYLKALIETVGLRTDYEAEKHPLDLALGKQTLLSIVNALATSPAVLILDEPTAHLASTAINRLAGLLASYRAAGGIVLCISHDSAFENLPGVQQVELANLVG